MAAVVGAAVVVLAAVGVGIYFAVEQIGGDEPSPSPAAASADPGSSDDQGASQGEAMSAEAGEALRAALEDDGWTCYDSLDEPVELDRCFLLPESTGSDDYTTASRVSIVHDPEGDLAEVTFRSKQSDAEAHTDELAGIIGDAVLDGHGDDLRTSRSGTGSTEISTARVSGGDDWFMVAAEDAEYTPIEGPDGTDVSTFRSTLKSAGATCKTSDEQVMTCEGTQDGYDLRATATVEDDTAKYVAVSVRSSYENTDGTVDEAVHEAADLVKALGLTDEAGVAFLTEDPAPGKEGDFAGRNLLVISARESGSYVSVYVSIDTIHG